MSSDVAYTLQAIASCVQALTACIGIPSIVISIYFVWNQVRQQTVATRATIYQNLTTMMLDIDRFFIDQPKYKPYFYGGVDIEQGHPDYDQVDSVAEMLMDFIDFVLTHKRELSDYPWDQWEHYFRFLYDSSPVLRRYWKENKDWFEKSLIDPVFEGKREKIVETMAATTEQKE